MRFISDEILIGLRKAGYIFVGAFALVILVSWHTDWPYLRNIYDHWATMKPTVCVCFALSAYMMLSKDWSIIGWRYTIAITCVLGVAYVMGILLIASTFHIYSGVEYLFADPRKDTMVGTIWIGLPSVGTMLSFLLLALYGQMNLSGKRCESLRYIVLSINLVAILGYITGAAWMHFWIPGVSSSTAFHAAVFFILLVL